MTRATSQPNGAPAPAKPALSTVGLLTTQTPQTGGTTPLTLWQNAEHKPDWPSHFLTAEFLPSTERAPIVTDVKPPAAHIVTRQIAQHFPQTPGHQSEIQLSPEELGRVRISLATSEQGATLHISADRPETLALLRRNIGLLGQDFAALGYLNLSFSFSQQGQRPDPQPARAVTPDTAPQTDTQYAGKRTSKSHFLPPATSGLDIRL
ncbi:hypothetical protein NBRC116601_21930 [Cognatishimia sp. WU-CL00825]